MAFAYVLSNGTDITGKDFKSPNGTSYPANWCYLATNAQLAELGIIKLTEIYPPLDPGYEYSGAYVDNLVAKTRTFSSQPYVPPFTLSGAGTVDATSILPLYGLITTVVINPSSQEENIVIWYNDEQIPGVYPQGVETSVVINRMIPTSLQFTGSVQNTTYNLFIQQS